MNESFAERLKEIRESNGWTQQQFAKLIGCSRATYSHYENGNRRPDGEILKSICEKTSISADYLLGLSTTKRVQFKQASELTGFSESALEYLQTKQSSNTDSVGGCGLENKVLDFIIREADFSELFDTANPNPFSAEVETILGPPTVPRNQIPQKCPDHILDVIKQDWGEAGITSATPETDASLKEEEETVLSVGGHEAISSPHTTPLINRIDNQVTSTEGLLGIAEEEYIDKQSKFAVNELSKSFFLDKLTKYLLFDKYDVSLCSSLGYQELSEDRDIVIKLGNTSIRFPSEESSQLIETMLLQDVIDSLKALKWNFRNQLVEL